MIKYILDFGMNIIKSKELEFRFGMMELNIKDNG